MKLLIKLNFENDYNLFEILDSFYDNISNIDNVNILINVNEDIIINEEDLSKYKNLIYKKNKIHPTSDFINSNIDDLKWDILLTSANLFKPIKKNINKFIINNTVKDIMWWKDKNKNPSIFSIKREYYERFGYVFNPLYYSFEYSLKEFKKIQTILNNNLFMEFDTIFETINYNEDDEIYKRRKRFNFTLKENFNFKENSKIDEELNMDKNKTINKNLVINRNIKSDYERLKNYLNKGVEFFIYKENKKIFHSKHNKNKIKLHPEYFEIFDKKYRYIGIQIKFN